jgi:hypothetical protein
MSPPAAILAQMPTFCRRDRQPSLGTEGHETARADIEVFREGVG